MSDETPETPERQDATPPTSPPATFGLRHLTLRGPDGDDHEYVSTTEAAEIIGKHYRRVQASCRAYWERITAEQEAEATAAGTGDTATGGVDYTPRPHELACVKIASAKRPAKTLVRVDTIPLHYVNQPREDGSRQVGNLPGWRRGAAPFHYKPRDQDRRYKATRERLAAEAARATMGEAQADTGADTGAGEWAAPVAPDTAGRTKARRKRGARRPQTSDD